MMPRRFLFPLALALSLKDARSSRLIDESLESFSILGNNENYEKTSAVGALENRLEEAILSCKNMVTCAGIAYDNRRQHSKEWNDEGEGEHEFFYHSHLPHLKPDSNWTTVRSEKSFTFLPGKIMSRQRLVVPKEKTFWTLLEAETFCQNHQKCVGFSFSLENPTDLLHLDKLTFHPSLDQFSLETDDSWRSYLSNDQAKAAAIDGSKVPYFGDDVDELPYLSCCNKKAYALPKKSVIEAADSLERISCNISMDDFHEKYEKTRTPVMLVGCDEEWPAKELWNYPALFKRFDPESTWRAEADETRGLKLEVPWRDIIDAFDNENITAYVFDPLDHELGKTVEQDYEIPPQFRADAYRQLEAFPTDYGSLRWFCLGQETTGTMPHMDPYATDAWNSLVSGNKWWILYPPSVTREDSIECLSECSMENPLPHDWYASVGINAARAIYPGDTRAQHVLQHPGETIYVPSGFLHSVYNVRDAIAVTANFGSLVGNLVNVWRAVLGDETARHWKKLYYDMLTREQRQIVRNSKYWPPAEGIELIETEEEDDYDNDDDEDDEEEG